MKNIKWIISCLAFLLAMVGHAQNMDEMKMKAAPVEPGKTWKVEVELSNPVSDQYTAFQMNLLLPAGWTYEANTFEVGTRLMAHSVGYAKRSESTLRIVGYSLTNMSISGNAGSLFSVVVRAPENVEAGYQTLTVEDVVMGLRDGKEVGLSDAAVRIMAKDPYQKYEINFMVDDTCYRSMLLFEGDTIPTVPQPEKEGHTFLGWNGLSELMPGHNLTVTAEFKVNSYKINYYLDRRFYARRQVKYGEKIVPPEVEDTPEATFSGWQNVPETMPAHDLKIYGETVPTGIESLKMTDLVTVYNLQGIRVLHDVTWQEAQRHLAKGIYLVNGKLHSIR